MRTNLKYAMATTGLVFMTIVGCKEEPKSDTAMTEEKIPGIVLENMDTTVSPKDDFYNYVNGNWAKNTTIPDDETRWGGFGVLRKETRQDVLDIVRNAHELGTYADGTDQKKALLLFQSELDSVARNEAGIEPIKPLLEAIEGIKNLNDMQTVYATVDGVGAPFAGLGASPNLNNSSMNMAWIYPGRSEEHTSELQSRENLVCRLLLEKKKKIII